MNRLKELKAEKFRILKDAELKGIIGRSSRGCVQTGFTSCDGTCFGPNVQDHKPDSFNYGTYLCEYTSFGCRCPDGSS